VIEGSIIGLFCFPLSSPAEVVMWRCTWFRLAVLSGLLIALSLVTSGWTEAPKDKKKPKTITNSIGMKLVLIPAGTFQMGSTKAEQDAAIADYEKIRGQKADETILGFYRAEGPRHKVIISKAFYLGRCEVTQKQYEKIMDDNPSNFSSGDFPVENVSWEDAQTFLKKLNALAAEKKYRVKYRLPTEAEWEYACRGGPRSSSKPFHFKSPSDSLGAGQANFDARYPYGDGKKGEWSKRTNTVGKNGEPNALGLFDMHGNVSEWCSDWYAEDYYGKSPTKDPQGPSEGSRRVFRGGGWPSVGWGCRAAYRNSNAPAERDYHLGFRVAAVPSE
jgi:formylglycine-generating enzyme required for sulfatase activity